MIKAQCHICHELFEVPDNRALTYVMMNLIPCRSCSKSENRQESKQV